MVERNIPQWCTVCKARPASYYPPFTLVCSFGCFVDKYRYALLLLAAISGFFSVYRLWFLLLALPSAMSTVYGVFLHHQRQTPSENNQSILSRLDLLPQEQVNELENPRVFTPVRDARPLEDQRSMEIDPHRKKVFIHELDQMYDICCYQTARIGEQYCLCGKAVDEYLKLYLN